MRHRKPQLTLGDLIQAVSQFAHNHRELELAVADLLQRGVVRVRTGHKHYRVVRSTRR